MWSNPAVAVTVAAVGLGRSRTVALVAAPLDTVAQGVAAEGSMSSMSVPHRGQPDTCPLMMMLLLLLHWSPTNTSRLLRLHRENAEFLLLSPASI